MLGFFVGFLLSTSFSSGYCNRRDREYKLCIEQEVCLLYMIAATAAGARRPTTSHTHLHTCTPAMKNCLFVLASDWFLLCFFLIHWRKRFSYSLTQLPLTSHPSQSLILAQSGHTCCTLPISGLTLSALSASWLYISGKLQKRAITLCISLLYERSLPCLAICLMVTFCLSSHLLDHFVTHTHTSAHLNSVGISCFNKCILFISSPGALSHSPARSSHLSNVSPCSLT